MKVLYVGMARALWLFDLPIWNPTGLNLQIVFQRIKEKYSFAEAPKHPLDRNEQNGLAFKSGLFVNSKKVPIIIALSIFNDGFVADSLSSTEDSTEFLVDMTTMVRNEFSLAVPENIKKAYVGQIDFESEHPLTELSPKLAEFLKLLQKSYVSVDGKARQFDAAGIHFWTEDVTQPLAPAVFKVERKVGQPFDSKHYFSQAPLETKVHIELLRKLEEILKA